ncbi:MAG: hypothetical protein OXI88_10715 [Gammaproteobacteria bacterium]|nr:hypothetical protein [Gammaproteobacteria bacterium]
MNKFPVLFFCLIVAGCAATQNPYRLDRVNRDTGRVIMKCKYDYDAGWAGTYCSDDIDASQPEAAEVCRRWGYKDAEAVPGYMQKIQTRPDVPLVTNEAGFIMAGYQWIR